MLDAHFHDGYEISQPAAKSNFPCSYSIRTIDIDIQRQREVAEKSSTLFRLGRTQMLHPFLKGVYRPLT